MIEVGFYCIFLPALVKVNFYAAKSVAFFSDSDEQTALFAIQDAQPLVHVSNAKAHTAFPLLRGGITQ